MNRLVSLTALLGERCCTDADTLQRYGLDWTRFCQPAPLAVLFPQTQEEVQEIVRIANREGLQLVPSGGRTGLSGGACATAGEVVVSLERMNRLLAFDATDRLMTVEAGMVTETLQQLARERGLYFPVDFASRGSSQVGGNVATNAGGIRVLRYGMFRDWVAGLTVVTGAGELLQLNHGLVKNNTGYDLRHLFVGSEGTLGLVTAVTLKLARPPADSGVMLFAVPQLADVMTVLARFRQFADPLAFEFFSDAALAQVRIDSSRLTGVVTKFLPSVILISGCQDNQTSMDGEFNGAFTGRLLEVWNQGRFGGNHTQFRHVIVAGMEPTQTPNLYTLGPCATFLAQKPFTF